MIFLRLGALALAADIYHCWIVARSLNEPRFVATTAALREVTDITAARPTRSLTPTRHRCATN